MSDWLTDDLSRPPEDSGTIHKKILSETALLAGSLNIFLLLLFPTVLTLYISGRKAYAYTSGLSCPRPPRSTTSWAHSHSAARCTHDGCKRLQRATAMQVGGSTFRGTVLPYFLSTLSWLIYLQTLTAIPLSTMPPDGYSLHDVVILPLKAVGGSVRSTLPTGYVVPAHPEKDGVSTPAWAYRGQDVVARQQEGAAR